jgi:pimeloyl-ACP methyl ester carboxylesterase
MPSFTLPSFGSKKMMPQTRFLKTLLLLFALHAANKALSQITLQTPHVNSILYLGKGKNQPLVVGLGGSEGGNAWASGHWKTTRDEFLSKGYAFLALGYFGAKETPDTLDRISIDAVHEAIMEACQDSHIEKNKIVIVGGSRGGDLALLLASYYADISCVVAIVPSHVVFPGHTMHFSTSCWTKDGKPLPFVPVNEASVPYLIKGDLRKTFEAMLKDSVAEQAAAIQVEQIKGPVLLLSATHDEITPSTPSCEAMMARLKKKGFAYEVKHLAIEGGHAEPLKHFKEVFAFMESHFPVK